MSAFIIYLFCLVVGFVFVLGTVLMGQFGGGHGHVEGSGGHAEAGADGSDSPGVSFFSPTVLAAFVTAFGAFGLIFSEIKATSNPMVSAALSLVCAFLVAGAIVGVLRKVIHAGDSSSESRVASLAGQVATVITPIPGHGVGEIAYVQAGTRYTAPAREENGTAVPSGSAVNITRVVGSQFYVRQISNSSAPESANP